MATPIFVPRPDPLTVLVPVWGAAWGVMGVVTLRPASAAISEGVPIWGLYVFFVGLLLTSSVALYGLRRRRVGDLRAELWGDVALGSLCLCYSGWAFSAYSFLSAWVIGSLLFILGVASFWQAARLNAWLRPKE